MMWVKKTLYKKMGKEHVSLVFTGFLFPPHPHFKCPNISTFSIVK